MSGKPLLRSLVLFFALGFLLAFALSTFWEYRVENERLLSYADTFSKFVEQKVEQFSKQYFQDVLLYEALKGNITWLTQVQLADFKASNPEVLEVSVLAKEAVKLFPKHYQIEAEGKALRVSFLVFDAEAQDFVKNYLVEVILDSQALLKQLGMDVEIELTTQGGKPFAFGLQVKYSGFWIGFFNDDKLIFSLLAGFFAVFLVLSLNYLRELRFKQELYLERESQAQVFRKMNEFFQAVLCSGCSISYPELLKKALEIIPHAQRGSLWVREGDFLVFRAAQGYPLDALEKLRFRVERLQAHPKCSSLIQGRPVAIQDLRNLFEACLDEKDSQFWLEKLSFENTKCSLWMPIEVEGKLEALLSVENFEKEDAFSPSEIEVFRIFAGQISAFFTRRAFEERLLLQAKKLDDQSKILKEMLNFMTHLLDRSYKFDYADILRKAVELVPGAQRGSLLLREGEVFVFKAAVGYDMDKLSKVSLTEGELSREMTREAKIIRNLDALNRSRISGEKLRLLADSGKEKSIQATLSVPLVLGEEIVGFFNLDNLDDPRAFGPEEIELAQLFAKEIGVILERLRLEAELEEQRKLLEHLSYHDFLTDLLNKRAFEEMGDNLLALAHREGKQVFLLYMDLKGFKEVNDRFGHDAGDAVLKMIAGRLRRNLRKNDLIVRIGGDEFVIMLYGGTRESVVEVLKRIVASVEEPFEWEGNSLQVSTNIGIAVYPQDGKDLKELVRKADLAMYRAKKEELPFAFWVECTSVEGEKIDG